MNKFIFGNFSYEYRIIRQDRKTLSLTVMPDMAIILKCSPKATNERIEKFFRKKWLWLEKQLRFFKKYQRKIYKKEYISGEGYLYLGRQYKLIVKRSSEDSVVLTKGKLIVFTTKLTSNSTYNKKLINSWFIEKTNKIFLERFLIILLKFNYSHEPILRIREMKKRWGSFFNKEKIVLNPKLIHASKDCIDYVITHELCHIRYKNHNKNFFNLLNEKYPKWEKIKEKLEMYVI